MATILFWNIDEKPLIDDIVYLCHSHQVDVLILAESKISVVALLEALNSNIERIYISPYNPSSRLSFFFRYAPETISLVSDEGGVAIRRITLPTGADILLVALHLSSKLYMSEDDQKFQAVRAANLIQEAESRVGHMKTLVIGDFNMNPFEVGLVGADCFHAVMDQNIAKKRRRTVQGQNRAYFYNPMWGLMGDSSPGPSGTYYYSNSVYVNYFWNTFDQVLLRPDLLDAFSKENLAVISKVGGRDLIINQKISSASSDHLPIMISLSIEGMIDNGH
jgi:hypothetical protein